MERIYVEKTRRVVSFSPIGHTRPLNAEGLETEARTPARATSAPGGRSFAFAREGEGRGRASTRCATDVDDAK